jgi:hypothetical protein
MADFTADDALISPPTIVYTGSPEPTVDAPVQQEEPSDEELKAREFDPRHKQSFIGLLYVGYLSREFEIYGHHFRIVTPTNRELLQIGPLLANYDKTVSAEIAYAQAMTAAYLHSIDKQELPQPISTNVKDTALQNRFDWVGENIRRPVINRIFEECLRLDAEVEGALEAMGKVPRQRG